MTEINIRRRMRDSRGCDAGYCYSKYQPLEKTSVGCLSVEKWEYFSGGSHYSGTDYALCGLRIEESDPLVVNYRKRQDARIAEFCERANHIGIAKALQEMGAEK